MSVLIQLGVDMDRGGVMITRDPFDAKNRNMVYISAVCGHNSRVVDNSGIPEQLLFNPRNNVISVMTLSQQQNALKFAPEGDLTETTDDCAGPNRRVLNDAQVRRLGRIAMDIKRLFGGKKEQDIEWGIMNGRIYIVQSRPYIDNK
jgi:phosphoenolpyruvate synthase/pyruvate phosphate dikinase